MKNRLNSILCLTLVCIFAGCSDWNDPETLDKQELKKNIGEYYENLRAYKKSDHQIAFGWFGGWTAKSFSRAAYLSSVPDSMDMVALWGNMWHREKMTPEKYADLKYVREVKGTKVVVTTLLGWTGKEFPNIPETDWPTDRKEGLKAYAKALSEEIIALGFDGLDIDYEPTIGGQSDVRDCPRGEDMVVFVKELGKYFGPQSGTGRILVIDGELDTSPPEVAHYFDYAISQAYNTTRPSSLQGRYNQIKKGFKTKQFIITENFESYWKDGGVDYNHPQLGAMKSLKGMALWHPIEGRKGGAGTYHMEYEYANPEIDYKYLREAIQIMNPAVK